MQALIVDLMLAKVVEIRSKMFVKFYIKTKLLIKLKRAV